MKTFRKVILALGITMLFLLLFLSPNSLPFVGTLMIGGVITGGILGGFSGKVGAVVGGKWKSTNYMRGHVIPANPNTDGQKNQRGKIGRLVSIAKSLLSTIVQPYWNPFYSTMSGYNAFVKANKESLAEATFDINGLPEAGSFDLDASFIMSQGTLYPLASLAGVLTTGTGALAVTWADNSGTGNALGTDGVVIVAINVDGTLYDIDTADTRSGSPAALTVPTGLTVTDVLVFGFAKRGTGASLIVSDSIGDVCAAP